MTDSHLLPGLAYIDLIYQCLHAKQRDIRDYELRDLTIHQPLMTENHTLPVTIAIDNSDPQLWVVSVTGQVQTQQSPTQQSKVKYATAKLAVINASALDASTADNTFTHYLSEQERQLANDAQNGRSIETSYALCRQQGIVHSGLMKAIGSVYTQADSELISIALIPSTASFSFCSIRR